jgi:hypothetical protein
LYEGQPVYSDRDYSFARVPDSIRGADLVLTANNDKKGSAKGVTYELELSAPGSILVLWDTRVPEMPWLKKAGFVRSTDVVKTDFDFAFRVYRADVGPGSYRLQEQQGFSFYSVAVLKK